MARKRASKNHTSGDANVQEPLGIERQLWAAADKLRGNLDSSEYKHVVLGLIFLKYVSDAFEERRAWLQEQTRTEGSEYYMRRSKYGNAASQALRTYGISACDACVSFIDALSRNSAARARSV